MQRPSSITVAKPVGKAVPAGKKVVYISCGISVCQLQGQIVSTAAKALGWTTSIVTTDGTPTSVQAAYDTALRQGANAIVTTAALRAEIASKLPLLQSKGVVVSDCCSTDAVAPPFIYNTSTPPQAAVGGKYLAAEVVADSKGKANTLYVNIPAFTILSSLGSEFKSAYSQYCPACAYSSIDVSLTQLAKAPNLIVSYLRSHPSVNYVALSVAEPARHRASSGPRGGRPVPREDRRPGRRSHGLPVCGQRPGACARAVRLLQRRLPDGRCAGTALRRSAGPAHPTADVADHEGEPARQSRQPVPERRPATRANS